MERRQGKEKHSRWGEQEEFLLSIHPFSNNDRLLTARPWSGGSRLSDKSQSPKSSQSRLGSGEVIAIGGHTGRGSPDLRMWNYVDLGASGWEKQRQGMPLSPLGPRTSRQGHLIPSVC